MPVGSSTGLLYLPVRVSVGKVLKITEDAATLVCTLTSDTGRRGQSGLRIVVDPIHHSLSMSIASGPAPADAVVRKGAAQVYLSPSAAHRLRRRTLRAELSADRSLFFLDS